MAFQPIVDVDRGAVFAYEALVRGTGGEGAAHVLGAVNRANRGLFDRDCRIRAIQLAQRLGAVEAGASLSINMMPTSVGDPANGIQHTIAAADEAGFPAQRIIFEFTEHEPLDIELVRRIIRTHRKWGFRTAIDDFGAGHSGLTLLAELQPDIVKLDMALIHHIDTSRVKQVIVGSITRMCEDLGLVVVAEGIETDGEFATLRDLGVRLMQGFLLAMPAFEALPIPILPGAVAAA
ncbi:MAG: EAL domain-containing protein [Caulobacteraceae bacterium]